MGEPATAKEAFAPALAAAEALAEELFGLAAVPLTHAEVEERLEGSGRHLLRQYLQNYLDLHAACEARLPSVVDAQGIGRPHVEAGHRRTLTTLYGDVQVTRLAYRQRGQSNLYPADAQLNLPQEQYSHGLRRLAAIEASRGSFDEAVQAVQRATGAVERELPKRQLEELTQRAAADFEAFYEQQPRPPAQDGDVLVLSADGKGIVMRSEALRPATARAAARSAPKLATRLSKGEKANRKRMAEVGAVYDATPVPRTAEDIFAADRPGQGRPPGPVAKAKWLIASVVREAKEVIADLFREAQRRDPEHRRPWLGLVDGNNTQLACFRAEAKRCGVQLTILIDFVHVLEYLWKAAWCFFTEGDPRAEAWVREKALDILAGRAGIVAAAIRRKATRLGLDPARRKGADTCADYLLRKRRYLDYPTALARGWPIATGVIEGACRHLVKDRLDVTGARWGLAGAEAVLKLRALRSNGDFEAYWRFHLAQEQRRVHQSRYAGGVIPRAA
jgi:hypothetical protein